MNAADEKSGNWFLRLPIDVVTNDYINENASATDWRVYMAIAKHQGYQNRRTYPIPIARTAEEARCSRRAAIRSISWWVNLGAVIKTKSRRMNVYEIPRHFSVPPRIGASPRHNTPKPIKRDDQGRFVPSVGTRKVPAHGTSEVPAHGTPNQKSFFRSLNQNPPPPPTGGDGRTSETSVQPGDNPPTPKIEISKKTLREWKKLKGLDWLKSYLETNNYPLYLLDELDEDVRQESEADLEGEKPA